MARSPASNDPPAPARLTALEVAPLLPSTSLEQEILRARQRSDLERLYDAHEALAASVQVAAAAEDYKNLPKLADALVRVHQAIHGVPQQRQGARPGRGEHEKAVTTLGDVRDPENGEQTLADTLKALGVPGTALRRGPVS